MLHSLQVRLTLLYMLLAIVPLGIVGTILGRQSYELQEQQVLTFEHQVATQRALQVRNFPNEMVERLKLAAEVANFPRINRSQQQQVLSHLIVTFPAFEEISAITPDGREELRVGRITTFTDVDLRDLTEDET